jgi:hypothetical protein
MNGKAYRYRITLARVGKESAGPDEAAVPLVFIHQNHDDIEAIVERMRASSGLDADSTTALGVGLKLLSEVMLQQRANPLFDVLRAPIREFIGELKARAREVSGQ